MLDICFLMTAITLSDNRDHLPEVITMLYGSSVDIFALFFFMKGFGERDSDQIKWSSKLNSG